MIRARVGARLSEEQLDGLGDEVWDELQPRAEKALADGAEIILQRARQNLSARRGTARTAAPAGAPPEYDEGELYRSLEAGKVRRTKTSIRQEYGSDNEYAGLHEFGGTVTKGGVKRLYPARPYLRPAEDTTADQVTAILEGL